MCGAISTECKTKGCKWMARYSLYCFRCTKLAIESDKVWQPNVGDKYE
jgi:hypothetical protein